jgi:hypothetical protein
METAMVNKLWLTKCTANGKWEDGGTDGNSREAGTG